MKLKPIGEELTQDEIDDTHPNFTVTCKGCGSTRVIFDNSLGWSPESGGWGDAFLRCLECDLVGNLIES